MIEVVAFDADDTLWHNEMKFQDSQDRLTEILDRYAPHDEVQRRLRATERRNIQLFGYGIKGFTLSMIETAIELSRQKISASEVHEIVMMGKAMLESPLELMEGTTEVLSGLGRTYRLLLITKGDLLDQTNKLDQSGLAAHFEQIEVVSEKDAPTYRRVFERHGVRPEAAIMVGNSLRSDALPVLELGSHAAHIPYTVTAEFERHDENVAHPRLYRLERIAELPDLLKRLGADD